MLLLPLTSIGIATTTIVTFLRPCFWTRRLFCSWLPLCSSPSCLWPVPAFSVWWQVLLRGSESCAESWYVSLFATQENQPSCSSLARSRQLVVWTSGLNQVISSYIKITDWLIEKREETYFSSDLIVLESMCCPIPPASSSFSDIWCQCVKNFLPGLPKGKSSNSSIN